MLKSIGSNVPDKEQFQGIKLAKDKMQQDDILTFSREDILESEKLYRTKLINSLAGIRQIALIGTKSNSGLENLAIFNSIIHLGAHPPLFGFISRPDSVERDSLRNIKETGSYTFNYMDKNWMKEAHQTSARYPKDQSEFERVGLTSQYLENCFAPFVKDASIKMEMKFQQMVDIEINKTKMIIGSMERVHIPRNRLAEDGLVKPFDLLLSGGLDAYYVSEFLEQLPYAKP